MTDSAYKRNFKGSAYILHVVVAPKRHDDDQTISDDQTPDPIPSPWENKKNWN